MIAIVYGCMYMCCRRKRIVDRREEGEEGEWREVGKAAYIYGNKLRTW